MIIANNKKYYPSNSSIKSCSLEHFSIFRSFNTDQYDYYKVVFTKACDGKSVNLKGLQILSYDLSKIQFDNIELMQATAKNLDYRELQVWIYNNGKIENVASKGELSLSATNIGSNVNQNHPPKNLNNENLLDFFKSNQGFLPTPTSSNYIQINFNKTYFYNNLVAVVLYNSKDNQSNIVGTNFIFKKKIEGKLEKTIWQSYNAGIQSKNEKYYDSYYVLGPKFEFAKKLDFLIVGDKPTNRKIKDAESLNIKVISQHEFIKMLDIKDS